MTIINIGTSKKNIVGAQVNKPFKEIIFRDVQAIALEHFGALKGIRIDGWVLIKEVPELSPVANATTAAHKPLPEGRTFAEGRETAGE